MSNTLVILDTNVFVAAAFNPRCASAHIVQHLRAGNLRLVWNESTRRECRYVLEKIPRLSWNQMAALFRAQDQFDGPTDPAAFSSIPDVDDRKFAALCAATGAVLLTNDHHLLASRRDPRLTIVSPREFANDHLFDAP